jgi:hypothetical protein
MALSIFCPALWRDTCREMKEMLESQRQALPIQTEVPARRASPEDNTIASLRTEIKALHGISEFLSVWVAHQCCLTLEQLI